MRLLPLACCTLISLVVPSAVMACSCGHPTVEEHILGSGAIFSGRVIALDRGPPDRETCGQSESDCYIDDVAHFQVDQIYKGPNADQLEVKFYYGGSMCGVEFTPFTEVMVFADIDNTGSLSTNLCALIPYSLRDEMLGEYSQFMENILSSRTPLMSRVNDEERSASDRFRSATSLVEMEQALNNPFGILEAIEHMRATALAGDLPQWQVDAFRDYALLAVSTGLRIGEYERAEPFMRIARAMGTPTARSELLEAYLDLRLGRRSPLVELESWPDNGHATLRFRLVRDRAATSQGQNSIIMQSIFENVSLQNVDFSGARFHDVFIIDSSIGSSIFEGVELIGVEMDNLWLSPVRMTNVTITDSVIRNVNMANAALTGATVTNSILQNVDLGDFLDLGDVLATNLDGAAFVDTQFLNVDLRFASLLGTDFHDATFRDVDLDFARYDCDTRWPSGIDPERLTVIPVESDCGDRRLLANLSNMHIQGGLSDLSGSDLTGGKFVGTRFYGRKTLSVVDAILRDADFSLSDGSVNFRGADLSGADFTNADIRSFHFKGSDEGEDPALLVGTRFAGVEIELADFYDLAAPERSASLSSADLEGAIFTCRFMGDRDEEAMTAIFRSLNPGARGAQLGGRCPRQ